MGERYLYQYSCSGASEKGPFQAHNEDAFCIKRAQTSYGDVALLVVSDGVGGLSYGELASAAIVKAFAQWFEQNAPVVTETLGARADALFTAVQGQWDGLLQMINLRIMQRALHEGCSMGATVTALLAFSGRALLVHVGDTRLYEIKDQAIRLITQDQIFGAETSSAGQEEPEYLRMALAQCVGASQVLHPDFSLFSLDDCATYTLCSDGFYESLTESELCDFLAPSRFDCAERLLNPDQESALWLRETGSISVDRAELTEQALQTRQLQHLQALTQVVLARGMTDNMTVLTLRARQIPALTYS